MLQNMRAFMRVVEAGSFVKAAEQLELSTPYVSRLITELESHLRARLLNRTTRRMALTPAGERFYARSQQILGLMEDAKSEAGNAHVHPSGRLRIHSIISFGQQCLIPLIAQYQARYPEVSVDLTLSQRLPDLMEEGYDVALTVASHLPDSGMIVKRMGKSRSVLCASPDYIARHGAANIPSDLAQHACIKIVSLMFPKEWYFHGPEGEQKIEVSGPFTVNVPEALNIAVREGMGIGLLPAYAAAESLKSGALVRLLPQYRLQEHSIFALYASQQFLDAKIKTWLDFLKKELPLVIASNEAML